MPRLVTCSPRVCGQFTEGFKTAVLKDAKGLLDEPRRLPLQASFHRSGLLGYWSAMTPRPDVTLHSDLNTDDSIHSRKYRIARRRSTGLVDVQPGD